MGVDESFKKQGTVPFKWEIKPGVPKAQLQQNQDHHHHHRSPPQKLRPPPSGSIFVPPPPEPQRTPSFMSSSRSRSERWRLDKSILFRSESVSVPMGMGCFPSPTQLKKKASMKKNESRRTGPDCVSSELETPSRWSFSSRKSIVSPIRDRSSSSSSSPCPSSCRWSPSPRPVSDAEWASFGLF
ncbi:uncharacterized protein LOC133804185 [Humulus lupulus]|uniref:uncharacterized protein LOC133804185 n=1 Tax=Humulus lupulus TaxID=3486 RepID=UPI002B412E9C|nr:uncharacterized protein LOC133804185 [Humulus lupulus]